jgi:hypothetical protein
MKGALGLLLAGIGLLPAAWGEPATPAAPPPAFTVVASVQYAHNEIYFHTPAGITPVLANTREIAPGQRVDFLVIVPHANLDAEGRADVTYDLTVRYPDGRSQTLAGNPVAAKRKVRPNTLLFPQAIRGFLTGPRDPFGEYSFEFTVHDRVSGASSTQSVGIHVTDSNRPLPLPDNFVPDDWLSQYYLRPEPRLALPALEAISGNAAVMEKGVAGLGIVLGFYGQVLADSPWLLPWFKQWYVAADEGNERHLLGLVLADAARRNPAAIADLPLQIQKSLAAIGRELPLPPAPAPENAAQLDALWGRFYGSGRFGPVADLVSVVGAYLPYGEQLDASKKAGVAKMPPLDVAKGALANSTLWSLRLNAHQHKLVHDYLLYLEEAPDTGPPVKAALAAALAWKPTRM